MEYIIKSTTLEKPSEDAKLTTFESENHDLLVSEWVVEIVNLDEFSKNYEKNRNW